MDSDYLLFAKAIELGSLSGAARNLMISPAMMSKRIARLEERLGVRLIHRTTRKMVLTPEGRVFHDDVIAILRAIETAENRVTNRYHAVSGPLTISAPTSFGRLHVAPYIDRFIDQYPDVEMTFDLSDAYVDLMADRVDVAIRITNHVPASLTAHRLMANKRILCASPAYVDRFGLPRTVGELSRHRLLAAKGQSPWKLINGRTRRTVEVRSYVATNSSEIVRELALAGVGIALRSLWDVEESVQEGQLIPLLEKWSGPDDLAVYAVHLKVPVRTAIVDAFIHFLKTQFEAFSDRATQSLSSSPSTPWACR